MAWCGEDGVTFSLDVGSPGATLLRTTIMEKLSEFIGSSTDDVLAEYVVVLVGHGKHRMQAIKDLEAFLGDQSGDFVTWLWDHLGSNMHLYTSVTKKSAPKFDTTNAMLSGEAEEKGEEIVERMPTNVKMKEKSGEQMPSEGGRLISLRKDIDTKLKKQVDSVATSQADTQIVNPKRASILKRPRSPDSWVHNEDSVSKKQQRHSSPSRVSATRRLLQSAFREAVVPKAGQIKRPIQERTSSMAQSSMKQLKSVLSADIENSETVTVEEHPTSSMVRRAMPAMMMAMKAAAAAAEDAIFAIQKTEQKPASRQLKKTMSGLIIETKTAAAEDANLTVQKDGQKPVYRQGKRVMPAMMMAMKAAAAAAEDATLTVHKAEQKPTSRQAKRARPAMMMALKAAAAAAEDVGKSRGGLGGNIWARLGKKSTEFAEIKAEDHSRYVFDGNDAEESRLMSDHEDEHEWKRQRLDTEDIISAESAQSDAVESVFDECTGQTVTTQNMSGGQEYDVEGNVEGLGGDYTIENELTRPNDRQRQSREESVTVEYRVARNIEGDQKEARKQKGSTISSALATSPQKIVNISVNVNTWKHGSYDKKLNATENNDQAQPFVIPNLTLEGVSTVNTTSVESKVANSCDMQMDGTKKQVHESEPEAINTDGRESVMTSEVQKAAVSSGPKQTRKPDDIESRMVFVTNIHFAASKESVAAHFVSCGEIGRIVMLTDGATGQPKGSAYIEFKTKDATDRALALNESTFFSRALKVVRKDAAIQAIQEMNPLMHPALIRRPIPLGLRIPLRGRFARAGISPFLLPPRRFPPMPRPYGSFPSLQWKRDSNAPAAVGLSGVINPSVTLNGAKPRSLSYVRMSNIADVVGAEPAKIVLESGKHIGMSDLEMEQA